MGATTHHSSSHGPLPPPGGDPAAVHHSSDSSAPALECRGIDRRFGAVHANRNVSLRVARGSIHGIIGENGAGKSTLMNIVYGLHRADAGDIRIDGRPVVIDRPADAIAAGVGMVHQHFKLVEPFTVLENVLLGREGGVWVRRGRAQARAALEQLAREYDLGVDLDAVAADLPVGLRQRVEILKALYRGARILILDEPTGVLTPDEARHLFRVLATLREEGHAVLLITHKLREIKEITDRVTVMRRGEVVADVATVDTSRERLAELMVGRKVALRVEKEAAHPGAPVLEVAHLEHADRLGVRRVRDVSLTVHRGEIVAVAGVSGNGQSELMELIAGIRAPDAGTIRLNGDDVTGADARAMRHAGLAHVPEDRLRSGLVASFTASESLLLGAHDDPAWGGGLMLDRRAIEAMCRERMREYDIRPSDPWWPSGRFSGGNQQKLVVARELARAPDLLLIGQPTRGVDIGAIEFIHRRIVEMRDRGGAVLLFSVELEEILALADRIAVMFEGAIVGELPASEATEQRLGELMGGLGLVLPPALPAGDEGGVPR